MMAMSRIDRKESNNVMGAFRKKKMTTTSKHSKSGGDGGAAATLPPHPSQWPQAPVMFCPTPGTSTKIRNIRYANINNNSFNTNNNNSNGDIHTNNKGPMMLPVNNGTELPGNSIVIDFESQYFIGTILMRIKDVRQWNDDDDDQLSNTSNSSSSNYFDGRKRRFQAVVTGTFKVPYVKMSECYTGQIFSRPAGRLPPRLLVRAMLKFVKTLAPQLDARIDCKEPRFLSPLIATAQTVIVTNECDNNHIEEEIEEPPTNSPTSIMQHVILLGKSKQQLQIENNNNNNTNTDNVAARMKARKTVFNALSSEEAEADNKCFFDTDKQYTFEFYQHMLVFHEKDDLNVQFGRMGNIPISPITNGQPIKFTSVVKNDGNDTIVSDLWSFDIWHQSMYPLAVKATSTKQ